MTWHIRVSFTVGKPFSEDAPFELTEALSEYAAVTSVSRDNDGGAVSLFIEAPTPLTAATNASQLVIDAAKSSIGKIDVTGLEVTSEEEFDTELDRPVFPEVVGYAEIAEIAGVSRQRARQFAELQGFPRPVIETAQGPLRSKSAVESWLENRPRRQPRKANAAA